MNKASFILKTKAPNMWSCLVIVLFIPILYYGLYFTLRGQRTANPQVIAHRGGRAHKPENTQAAFRNAIELGVDWLEFDVQRTKDGVLVVFHDISIERTTNGTGKVADLTFDELRRLDAGDGERVPTFREVIALAKEGGVGILPEAKSPHLYPGIEAELLAEIKEADYLAHTGIQSFDHDLLESVLAIERKAQICPLYGLWKLSLRDPQVVSANTLCPMAEMVILNPWMVRQAHSQGRQVYVWFGAIEHPMVMRILLAMGVDGLMVDDPAALADILGRS